MLLNGVSEQLPDGTFAELHDSMIYSAEPLARWLFAFQVPNKWSKLAQMVTQSSSVASVVSELEPSAGLLPFLWMLKACELLKVYTIQSSGLSSNMAIQAELMAEQPRLSIDDRLETSAHVEYQKRMGQDYYAFLGLPGTVSQELLLQRARQLIHQWRSGMDTVNLEELDSSVLVKINSLAFNLYDIWAVFLSSESKAEYDQQRRNGLAPIAGRICTRFSGAMTPLPDIRALVYSGAYAKAFPLLEQQSTMHFQHPEILALLGWTRWNLGAYEIGLVMIEVALLLEESAETLAIADLLCKTKALPPQYEKGLRCLLEYQSMVQAEALSEHAESRAAGGLL